MSCAVGAVCALDGARVEAYANSYHGDSWVKRVHEIPGTPRGDTNTDTNSDTVRGTMATQKYYKRDL